jgi:hypothetical protein
MALPENGGLSCIIARGQRRCVFPNAARQNVVLKILSDARQMLNNRYAEPFEFSLVIDIDITSNPRSCGGR